jgi:hypothetical protein
MMKNDVMPSIVQMEPRVLRQLVAEVQETVATDVDLAKEKKSSFGIVDLWNIRRNGRASGDRIRKSTIITGIGY